MIGNEAESEQQFGERSQVHGFSFGGNKRNQELFPVLNLLKTHLFSMNLIEKRENKLDFQALGLQTCKNFSKGSIPKSIKEGKRDEKLRTWFEDLTSRNGRRATKSEKRMARFSHP